ncbi:uncharacterized protein LOC126659484 [Mercurialis annua]|uniref:uncharacterized protein LOC126659484 n=1 Tax=Mercurialis annua TaxID=3986 RepID=UPI00215F27B2|nr:uncharacterized protein LOC126659484 [Mercurialis annua]
MEIAAAEAVFPCTLKIIPGCIFRLNDPIILGVEVVQGILRVGTPICVPRNEFIDVGQVARIEKDFMPVYNAMKGQKVAIKIINNSPEEQQKLNGMNIDFGDLLVSHISRRSIDALKTHYRHSLSMNDWRLVVKLKKIFNIQ